MISGNQNQYLQLIKLAITTKQQYISSIEDLRNTAESAMTSRYDTQRETLDVEARSQEDLLIKLKDLLKEMSKAKPMSIIDSGAEIVVNVNGEEVKGLYSKISASVDGIKIITPYSPLGAAIKGKKVGDEFVFNGMDAKISGVICSVS